MVEVCEVAETDDAGAMSREYDDKVVGDCWGMGKVEGSEGERNASIRRVALIAEQLPVQKLEHPPVMKHRTTRLQHTTLATPLHRLLQ